MSLWAVSRKSRHLGIVLIELAAAISSMQMRHGPPRGSWLVADGVGGRCHPKSKPLSLALARPNT